MIELDNGVILDPTEDDYVEYLLDLEGIGKILSRFDKGERGKVKEAIYEIVKGIYCDFDLDKQLDEDEYFQEFLLKGED